jgi:hypothetical protein
MVEDPCFQAQKHGVARDEPRRMLDMSLWCNTRRLIPVGAENADPA